MKEQNLGYGQNVQGFSSEEELFEFLASQRQAAIDALPHALPAQHEITFGSFVFRAVPPDLSIFGRILREDEFGTDEEGQEELAMTREARTRGLIYGKWYSKVVPEGEYGSAHIIQCWPITLEEFEEATSLHWQLWPKLWKKVRDEIEAARLEGEDG